jgi:hypothetical protein
MAIEISKNQTLATVINSIAAINGLATLDGTGKVPAGQLPTPAAATFGGDGSLGNVTIAAPTTLSGIFNYNNLTVNALVSAGVERGLHIKVRANLSFSADIWAKGFLAGAAGGAASYLGFTPQTGGAGTAATAVPQAGTASGGGGGGGSGGGFISGLNGSAGGAGGNGANRSAQLDGAGQGTGGAGAPAPGFPPYPGIAGTAAGASTAFNWTSYAWQLDFDPPYWVVDDRSRIRPGNPGGGGGGGGSGGNDGGTGPSGFGGAGGAGGDAGNPLIVEVLGTCTAVGAAKIRTSGGPGVAGAAGTIGGANNSSGAGAGGGGGGSAASLQVLVAGILTPAAATFLSTHMEALGGAGGAGGAGAASNGGVNSNAGGNGAAGSVGEDSIKRLVKVAP